MKTELIASWKLVSTKNGDKYVVTTISGAEVWVAKSQFDTNAEQISYEFLKAGSDYTNKAGVIDKLKNDRNEFKGCGKQIVKKFNTMELLEKMAALEMKPTFALS
jgi:hypothetical protein